MASQADDVRISIALRALKDAEALLTDVGLAHVLKAERSQAIYQQLQRVRAAIVLLEG